MNEHQRICLQQLIEDFRRSKCFSDEQISRAVILHADRLTPPSIERMHVEELLDDNGLKIPLPELEHRHHHPGHRSHTTKSATLTTNPPKDGDPANQRPGPAFPIDSGNGGTSDTESVKLASMVVAISAAAAGAVNVIRNIIGSVKDSLDIQKHLRESDERRAKKSEKKETFID